MTYPMDDESRFERDRALYRVITQHGFTGSRLARYLYDQYAAPEPKPEEPGEHPHVPVEEPEGDEEEEGDKSSAALHLL